MFSLVPVAEGSVSARGDFGLLNKYVNKFIQLFCFLLYTPCPGVHPRANLASRCKVNIWECYVSATWNVILSLGNIRKRKYPDRLVWTKRYLFLRALLATTVECFMSRRTGQVCYRVVCWILGVLFMMVDLGFMWSSAGDHRQIIEEWERWSVGENAPPGP